MPNLNTIILAILILGIQYFLSTRDKGYWGAILPIAYILFLLTLGTIKEGNASELIYPGIFGIVVLLSEWFSGRDYVEKKRKKEMDKLEIQNM